MAGAGVAAVPDVLDVQSVLCIWRLRSGIARREAAFAGGARGGEGWGGEVSSRAPLWRAPGARLQLDILSKSAMGSRPLWALRRFPRLWVCFTLSVVLCPRSVCACIRLAPAPPPPRARAPAPRFRSGGGFFGFSCGVLRFVQPLALPRGPPLVGKLLSSPFGFGAVLPARAALWSRATSARLQVRWGKTSAVERFDLGAVCNPALIDAWLFVFYRCYICSGFGLVYG